METKINLVDVENFITSDKFTQFLLSNTTDFGTAAFILQALFDKINEIKESKK